MPAGGRVRGPGAMVPSIRDKSLLAGELTPERIAEWVQRQSPEYQEWAKAWRTRDDAIKLARSMGFDWFDDPSHYRAHPKYCKCPGGTVDHHNRRFQKLLDTVVQGGR